MTNRFEKGLWPNRQTQFADRRRQIATSETDVYDIERVEGVITEPGKAFNQENMESLENRIYNAFDTLESSDIEMTDSGNIFTATTVDGALQELFTYADNGKTAIATAIGSEVSTSDTFQVLASAVSNGKLGIANALGDSTLQTSTFANLASLVAAKKKVYTKAITVNGTLQTTATITQHFDVNFGFTPSKVFVSGVTFDWVGYVRLPVNFDSVLKTIFKIKNITSTGFNLVCDGTMEKYLTTSTATLNAIE